MKTHNIKNPKITSTPAELARVADALITTHETSTFKNKVIRETGYAMGVDDYTLWHTFLTPKHRTEKKGIYDVSAFATVGVENVSDIIADDIAPVPQEEAEAEMNRILAEERAEERRIALLEEAAERDLADDEVEVPDLELDDPLADNFDPMAFIGDAYTEALAAENLCDY